MNSIKEKIDQKKINILNIDLNFQDPFKVSRVSAAKFVKRSLDMAHLLCEKKLSRDLLIAQLIRIYFLVKME